MLRWLLLICICLSPSLTSAENSIHFSGQFPYRQERVAQGELVNFFLSVERDEQSAGSVDIKIELPENLRFIGKAGWMQDGAILRHSVAAGPGYSSWFDLLKFKIMKRMEERQSIRAEVGGKSYVFPFTVSDGQSAKVIKLRSVILPLDERGFRDQKLAANVLTLQELETERIKNIVSGKGAGHYNAQWLLPRAYVGITISNAGNEQEPLLLSAYLLDKNSSNYIKGLYFPDENGALLTSQKDRVEHFLQADGSEEQTFIVPIFLDGGILRPGDYILRWELQSSDGAISIFDAPIALERGNLFAGFSLFLGFLILCVATLFLFCQLPRIMKGLKTVDYIRIAMLGVISLLVVNLPTNLLWGVSHILLGPFGSLLTGIFSTVFMSVLTIILLMLVPKPGIMTLFALVKLLLSAIVFGRISPVTLITVGVSCIFIETALRVSGMYVDLADFRKSGFKVGRKLLTLAFFFAAAKALSSFINLQGMIVLYRMYYADWYVVMTVVMNGFCYAFLGTLAGYRVGSLLVKLKSD